MRLLVLTSSLPRYHGDMAGDFVAGWGGAQRARGHEVRVLAWRGPGAQPQPEVRWVAYDRPEREALFFGAGAPERLEQHPWRAAAQLPPAMLAMLGVGLQQTRAWRPDLIVGHWLVPSGALARLLGQLTDTPAAIVTHSAGVHLLHRAPSALSRPLARWLGGVPMTFVSAPMQARFEARAPLARASILPMGFTPAPGADAPGARPDWLIIGRLVPIKRVALAIEAFARAQLGPNATLHIAGDGPLRAELEARSIATRSARSWRAVAARCSRRGAWARAMRGCP